jgi:glycosyltransferase involved in cell wall biosynthesis
MRIAFLLSHLNKGGMQRAVSNLTRALPDGVRRYVVYFGTEHPGFPFDATEVLLEARGDERSGFVRKAATALRRIRLLRGFVRSERIEAVVSFGEAANVLNLATPHAARKVISIRVSLEASLKALGRWGRVYRFLIRRFYPRAHCAVPCSAGLGEELARLVPGRHRIRPIPNLYPRSEIERLSEAPLRRDEEALFDRPVVLNVGSYSYQKGQDSLIRALALVKRSVPEARLVLMGEGPGKERLAALVAGLGLSADVSFLGFDANPYRFMRRASCFALSSRYEGFPNVLVEAMICGCPVVAFDCPTGPREILGESGAGPLVRPGDVDGLSAQIAELLRDPDRARRYAALGRERASAYASEIVAPLWMGCLRDVIEGARPPRGRNPTFVLPRG